MILGIDPGLHGALVLYDPTSRRVHQAANLPTFEITRNGKTKNVVDLHGLVALVRDLSPIARFAFLELVGPMPNQGVSSVWSFARTDCAPETALVCFSIPYERVPPGVWKKAVGAPADKDGARLRASQLMPNDAWRWTPKRGGVNKLDAEGIAEAALIAYYGAQKFALTSGCAPTYNKVEGNQSPTQGPMP